MPRAQSTQAPEPGRWGPPLPGRAGSTEIEALIQGKRRPRRVSEERPCADMEENAYTVFVICLRPT